MTSKNGASMAFGWIHRRQVTNKFEGADAGDGRGAPGILLALENIRWLVSFIPRRSSPNNTSSEPSTVIGFERKFDPRTCVLLWFRVQICVLHCEKESLQKYLRQSSPN